MRHTKQCLEQSEVTPRQKSCHECSSAKSRCDQQRPRCSRCVERNARCEYVSGKNANHVNPPNSNAQLPHSQVSDDIGNAFLETLAADQQTWDGQITSMDYLPPNGQGMPDQNVPVASENSSNHSTPLSTNAPSCASTKLSNRTIDTAATSNQSPKDSDYHEQTGQLVPDADFSLIRDRWLYPYIEPSPLSYALREQSMFYLCRVFRTYPRMMARRERLPPMIHPMQASQEMPLPLKNCFSITRMWEGGAEEASSLVQGTIEREMERLFAEVSISYRAPFCGTTVI